MADGSDTTETRSIAPDEKQEIQFDPKELREQAEKNGFSVNSGSQRINGTKSYSHTELDYSKAPEDDNPTQEFGEDAAKQVRELSAASSGNSNR